MWILIGLAVAVIVVVAGVVGGVVGSQAAKTNNDGQKSTSTGSNVTESDDTPSTATSTDTPTVTVTAQTQTPTSSNDSDTLARFYMFGLGNCDGSSDTYNVTTAGNMCYPVPSNKRSIFVSKNSDCIISTRSGTDCGGKSFTVPDTGECHGVLYAAVSVVC
ncbi:hypothetical protein BDV59DRAFT_113180 [Aspergillus ambiguus]|uniref:uncharacterized protein n=1 Tax=Aspergillus ambiguus TaxID=176160 RepID=UPI003CCDAFD0